MHPSLSWLIPTGMSTDALVTRDPARRLHLLGLGQRGLGQRGDQGPGDDARPRGRHLDRVLLLATYAIVSVATRGLRRRRRQRVGLANPDNSDDVFNALGSAVFGNSAFGKVMVTLLIISVLTSAAASTQTTILPTARTSLSMAAYQAIPTRFANIHPKYLTPTDSTIWMGAVSIIFYVALTLTSQNVLGDSIAAVGLLIAFYYGLTGFACVWYYRKTAGQDACATSSCAGVFPFLGGAACCSPRSSRRASCTRRRLRQHLSSVGSAASSSSASARC